MQVSVQQVTQDEEERDEINKNSNVYFPESQLQWGEESSK